MPPPPKVKQRVLDLLSDPRFYDESTEDELSDALLKYADEVGWIPIAGALIAVLEDLNLQHQWHAAVCALFRCDCQQRAFPCERSYVIALLYDCLQRCPNLGVEGLDFDYVDNLVWSIVHQLKGVGYLDPYDPQLDPQVVKQKIVR